MPRSPPPGNAYMLVERPSESRRSARRRGGCHSLSHSPRPGNQPGSRWPRRALRTTPGSCGIPSTWHRPTTRRPGGSPRRVVSLRRAALPPGRRVVALREVDGMPHPAATTSPATPPPARPSRRPAARRGHEPLRPQRGCPSRESSNARLGLCRGSRAG